MPKRCVNIDWLEVHAREPQNVTLDVEYYASHGYYVVPRDYGTRVYREMFVIYGPDDMPFIEVRRNPASQGLNGIHDAEECHLRLVNRACYFNNSVNLMKEFLDKHGYQRVRISRVDICLDFDKFDSGDVPANFVARYFKQVFSKINQCNISSRGADTWEGQTWNSLSWGSTESQVSTKLYNKTMELYDLKTGTFKKPYILQAWRASGYIDNVLTCTRDGMAIDMWRLEFSIKSPKAKWVKIELNGKQREYQSLRHTLETYDNRGKMLVMFASLANHYFRFKYYEEGKRKDRCQDKVLFNFKEVEEIYKLQRDDYATVEDNKNATRWIKLIPLLMEYRKLHWGKSIREACDSILGEIQWDIEHSNLVSPWNENELREFREFVEGRMDPSLLTDFELTNEIREALNIKDRTLKKFKTKVNDCENETGEKDGENQRKNAIQ